MKCCHIAEKPLLVTKSEMNITKLHQVKYGMRKELIFREQQLEQTGFLIRRNTDLNCCRERTVLRAGCWAVVWKVYMTY